MKSIILSSTAIVVILGCILVLFNFDEEENVNPLNQNLQQDLDELYNEELDRYNAYKRIKDSLEEEEILFGFDKLHPRYDFVMEGNLMRVVQGDEFPEASIYQRRLALIKMLYDNSGIASPLNDSDIETIIRTAFDKIPSSENEDYTVDDVVNRAVIDRVHIHP